MKEKHKPGIYWSISQYSWFQNNFEEKHKMWKKCNNTYQIWITQGLSGSFCDKLFPGKGDEPEPNYPDLSKTLAIAFDHVLHENWTEMEKMRRMESDHQDRNT